jgi:hypothetical protein
MTEKQAIKILREALTRAGCQFSACYGPRIAPVPMATCYACEALYLTAPSRIKR